MRTKTQKNIKTKEIYLYFNPSSIKKRMLQDIHHFKGKPETKIENECLSLFTKSTLDPFKEVFNLILGKIESITHEKSYYYAVYNVEESKQKTLWVCRTYLFYTLLLLVSKALILPDLFREIFQDKLDFNNLVHKELSHYKIGLFGSIKPTSDIDVGIQYNRHKIAGLHYIVHAIEESFLIFTKRSCLDYDIEIYADILTSYQHNKDLFYLDSSNFGIKEFNQLLPYLFNSIVRNMVLRRLKDGTTLTWSDLLHKLHESDTAIQQFCTLLSISKKQFYSRLKEHYNNAHKEIHTFLSMPYSHQRYAYYEKVKRAEEYKNDHYSQLNTGKTDIEVKTMCLMADSLTYRMESYLCAPTILHIVRVLQAKKGVADYKRETPDIYCKNLKIHEDAFCSIGLVGYMISLFEQVGYLVRFFDNPKKLDKYNERLKDATDHIDKIYVYRTL
jgi:hypothetical protein